MKALSKKKTSTAWRLYIIRCCDGTLYTGITNDLDRRIEKHNNGTASRYTRCRLPVTLVHSERCLNKSTALKKECRIKALTRDEKLEYVAGRQSKASRNVLAAKRRKSRRN